MLAEDMFMPEMHLRQLATHANIPGFTCGACGPFTKNYEKAQKLKETEDNRYT